MPLSFFDTCLVRVLSRNAATSSATITGDEKKPFTMSLNCNHENRSLFTTGRTPDRLTKHHHRLTYADSRTQDHARLHECRDRVKRTGRERTHRAPVYTGPWPARIVNSLKYSGTERPRKMEIPTMKMFRVMFIFANWSWEIPVPAVCNTTGTRSISLIYPAG